MPTPLSSRLPPTLVLSTLAAIAIVLGCSAPIYVEGNPYQNSQLLTVPPTSTGPDVVYVRPLGLRAALKDSSADLRIDILIAGPRASQAAQRWVVAAREGADPNAILSLRRVEPTPRPLTISFADERITLKPLTPAGDGTSRGLNTSDDRILLTLHLDTDPTWSNGTYDVMLQVPSQSNSKLWDLADLTIHLDQHVLQTIITSTQRLPFDY